MSKKGVLKQNIEKVIKIQRKEKIATPLADVATVLINSKYDKKKKRSIWDSSNWINISKLENDDVGKVGEEIIGVLCKKAGVPAKIDGMQTKERGGGIGDGKINGKTVEIKTARLGSAGNTFQHELGEVPWKAEYMLFFDIAPKKMYITKLELILN